MKEVDGVDAAIKSSINAVRRVSGRVAGHSSVELCFISTATSRSRTRSCRSDYMRTKELLPLFAYLKYPQALNLNKN